MNQILKNIVAVSAIEASQLDGIVVIPKVGVFLIYDRNFVALPLVGLASCEIVSETGNKSRLYKTTLSGLLSDYPAIDTSRPVAFLIEAVDGDRYLIGGPDHPYPIVNTSEALPGKAQDPAGCTLTVEFSDLFGLLRVLD
jgi:hypothetical protein